MIALALALLLTIFHREIFFGILLLILRPEPDPSLQRIWFSSRLSEGSCFFRSFFGPHLFFHPELWDQWSRSEQTAVLLWAEAASQRYGGLRRLLGSDHTALCDRDALLTGAQSIDLIGAIEKAYAFYKKSPNRFSPLSGLGLLGHPPYQSAMEPMARAGWISHQQTRLLKP